MKKIALFSFNGDPVCFIHVLLNALDMNEKGYELKLIIEGSAVKMVKELANLQALYTDQHPDVIRLKAKIIDLESKFKSGELNSLEDAKSNSPLIHDRMQTSKKLDDQKRQLAQIQLEINALEDDIQKLKNIGIGMD